MENKKRDLIDRGQINYTWWELPNGKFTDGVTLQSVIHSMPTIDAVEVVHGHWIEGLDGSCMCSECSQVIRYEIGYYCPNCGAKMDGGNKHE